MSDKELLEALTHNAAATLAAAVISNMPDNLVADMKVEGEPTRTMNLFLWEEHRIFYHAIKQSMDDEQYWPSPKSGAGASPASLPSLLQPLIAEGGVVGPIASQLLAALLARVPAPAAPTPAPSTSPPTAGS